MLKLRPMDAGIWSPAESQSASVKTTNRSTISGTGSSHLESNVSEFFPR